MSKVMLQEVASTNADAFTFRFAPKNDVITVILSDKILWNEKHDPYSLGFVRLATILAQEIYGNAASDFKMPLTFQHNNDPLARLNGEINGYQVGINFGNQFVKDTKIPPTLREMEAQVVSEFTTTLDDLKQLKSKSSQMSADELKRRFQQIFVPAAPEQALKP